VGPLIVSLASVLGLSEDEVDAFWMQAAAIQD